MCNTVGLRRVPVAFEGLEDRRHLSLTVKLDYSRHATGFFASQTRRDVMQAAVDAVAGHIKDSFSAIVPGGDNTWTVNASDPGSNSVILLKDATVTADTVVIYVGSKPLVDIHAAAVASLGAIVNSDGDAAWETNLDRRGRPVPADGPLATPAVGSISFDPTIRWYFGLDAAGIASNQSDFYSVAQHEFGHIFGVGSTTAWHGRFTNNLFTGPVTTALYGGPVPTTNDGGGHLAAGLRFDGQLATMANSPTGYGRRESFTRLDYAIVDDMGYDVSPPPPITGRYGNVTGYAFYDANKNKIRDAGEHGFGAVVYLDANNDGKYDNNEIAVTTDADGKFLLASVPVGVTRLGVYDAYKQYEITSPAAPYFVGIKADKTTMVADQVGQVTSAPSARIGGSVFNDANSNGAYDKGETIRVGLSVYLDANDNETIDSGEMSAVTDAQGNCRFTGLLGGPYDVRFALPVNIRQTTPAINVSVVAGDSASPAPAGVRTRTGSASISGFAFKDADQDGSFDPGETNLSGRTVFIDLNFDGNLEVNELRVITDSSGGWKFTNLVADDYLVAEVLPASEILTTGALQVDLDDGEAVNNQQLGSLYVTGALASGFVFIDEDQDGYPEPYEKVLTGVTVFLDLDDDGVRDGNEPSVVTGNDGGFSFKNLAAGRYHVRRVFSPGYGESTPAAYVTLTSGQAAAGVLIGSKLK